MKKILLIFIFIFVITSCQKTSSLDWDTSSRSVSETVSILSFNIQIFGISKMSKPEIVDILVDIVQRFDLIAIQEVRDSSGNSVVQFMSLLDKKYKHVLGPREGRSSSKEQYWFIYDSTKFRVLNYNTYPDLSDTFERRPKAVYFEHVNGIFDFVVINKHVAPGDALREISYTPKLFDYYYDLFGDPDIILLGDLNADGSYFKESLLVNIFPEDRYKIIIDNSLNTTVAASQNTYDRIIVSKTMFEDFQGDYGVFLFEEYYDFSQLSIEPKHISDHYPVWARFYIDRDTD